MKSRNPARYLLVLLLSCGRLAYSQPQVVGFDRGGQLDESFFKALGAMPVQEDGGITFAPGKSSIWYTTDPGGTSMAAPYGFPADSTFAYGRSPLRVSMDFKISPAPEGKLVIPGLQLFNPLSAGVNSGVIALFSGKGDDGGTSFSGTIALRYVNDPAASSLGEPLPSASRTGQAVNWSAGDTEWFRLELLITPVSSTSASFTANLYSIAAGKDVALLASVTTAAIDFGTTESSIDLGGETRLALGIRNYIDPGGRLTIDRLVIEPAPGPADPGK